MPGLLQTDQPRNRLVAAVSAEFIGTFLFAFFGGAAPGSVAAPANGIALAVLVYVTANVSGGHLNPAVTIATMATGHTSASRGLAYIAAQIAGSVLASAMHIVTLSQAFGWEVLMTFLLLVTIYSVAVGEPSFGIVGPLAIGLALWAVALVGGNYTGAALNPARVLGPAIIFGCYWKAAFVYILAEVLGALAGSVLSWPLYGTGLQLGRWWDEVEGAVRGGYQRLEGVVAHAQ
eukprot:gene11074-11230_t